MINFTVFSVIFLIFLLSLVLVLCVIDYRKKRVILKKPFVSFIVPCYNDGQTVENTIKSIYSSYPKDKFELIVIDDSSTDDSFSRLKKIQKGYKFILKRNKINLGKSVTLNNAVKDSKYEILFFVDADLVLNNKSVIDILARLSEKNVVAVSAPYRPINKGFLAKMQEIEYNMLSLVQASQNSFSTISLWGGCFSIKKNAFNHVSGFSLNAITEDMDLALKLKTSGYVVEQIFHPVMTHVPDTFKGYYNQKIRWSQGGTQNLIKHYKIMLKEPISVVFITSFVIFSLFFVISLINQVFILESVVDSYSLVRETTTQLLSLKITGLYYGSILLKNFFVNIYFTTFSLPYAILMVDNLKQIYKVLYLIPFSLIYMPIYSAISAIGFITAIFRYNSLKNKKRVW